MSSISAGTTSGTALVSSADTSGTLQLQINGTTPAVTLNTSGAVGVGSSPAYGSSGQVLTSGGSGAVPTWTTPSAGAMALISTQTANASTSITFTGLATYSKYQIIIENLYGASAPNLFLQLGYGATPTYITSNYQYLDTYAIRSSVGSNLSLLTSSLTDSGVQITAAALGPSSYNGMSGVIYITNMLATAGNFKTSGTVFIGGDYNGNGGAVAMSIESISFSNPDTNAKTAIKLYVPSGTMTAKFSLYGISS